MARELQKLYIRDAAERLEITDYLDYKKYFLDLYDVMKAGNERYSYLLFAEDLGFNATTAAHQIVRGHRPLSSKNAQRVVKALGLTSKDKSYFVGLIDFNNAKSVKQREEIFANLLAIKQKVLPAEDKEQLQFFAEWQHSVVREMLGIEDFARNPEKIHGSLIPHVDAAEIKRSIELLVSLGFIVYDEAAGRYQLIDKRLSTGPRVKGMAYASYHRQMMSLAVDSLATTKGKERDISAITVSVDEQSFAKLRAMIHAFQLEVLREAEQTETPDKVVQMNIQLFPLSSGHGSKAKTDNGGNS